MAPPSPADIDPASPPLNSRPRVKKKVRMEVLPDEQPITAVDTFHVNISNIRASLRVAEARPVFLSFEFGKSWYAETDVYAADIEPVWGIDTSTIRTRNSPKPSHSSSDLSIERDDSIRSQDAASVSTVQPSAAFVYETEFGYKLHKQHLTVTLSERSPYGDVEWGSADLPLDSIARGCQALDLSIMTKDRQTWYGNVTCNITMLNVQTVCAHLTDMKLSDYPEAYKFDVKLIYLEFGLHGFEDGYYTCTEKRSETEPRFSAQPALQRDVTLQDMLSSSASGSTSLKIFFSVHRQVARNRTEEIGVGALPVRMLFSKVSDGWMDVPTKFKVPLANYKGVIRGKVLLRDIPQFSQLPGADLVNVNGAIYPLDVDLDSRKLQPWVKLPRSLEARMPSAAAPTELSIHSAGVSADFVTEVVSEAAPTRDSPSNVEQTSIQARVQEFETRNYGKSNWNNGRYNSSVTESASDGGSDSSGTSPQVSHEHSAHIASIQDSGYQTQRVHYAQSANALNGRSYGVQLDLPPDASSGSVRYEELVEVRTPEGGKDSPWPEFEHLKVGDSERAQEGSSGHLRSSRSKSGKSVGSIGTGDGGVEIGSVVLSAYSDDGYVTGSRTTTEDALTASQRLIEPPPEDAYEEEGDDDAWAAIEDPSSSRYYFAHRYTQESLWLPPDWERMEDEDGRQYFVDHGRQTTQRAFPAEEARAYRASVYAG